MLMHLFNSGKSNVNVQRSSRYVLMLFSLAFLLKLNGQTPIDLSRPVGQTEGSAGTNGQGGASFTLPINLPAGIGGYRPPVSVSYSSQGNGSGFCGHGWNLSPISMVSRSGKTYFKDGVNTPVDYTSTNDAFLLDGQRLMLKSGTYGADGSTYGLEQEDFSEITSYGVWYNAPESFLVRQKDGTMLDYGWQWTYMRTYGGASKVFWLLSAIRDANNNEKARFLYNIDETDRTYYLSAITYSNYIVAFTYDTKTDWQNATTYLSGEKMNSKYILNKIEVKKIDGTPIRSYSFSYQYREKKYFLTSVTEAGADGTTLNPITFAYGENTTVSDINIPSTEYTGFLEDNFTADFTGDGKDDIQTYGYSMDNDGMKHYTKYKITNEYSSYAGWPAINWVYDYTLPNYTTNGRTMLVGSTAAQYPFTTADYDGDGKQDVLYCKFEKLNTTTLKIQGVEINYSRKYYYPGGGNDTYENKTYNSFPSDGTSTYYYMKNGGGFFTSGDFDGDGHTDYIMILSNSTTANNYKAFFSCPAKGVVNKEISNFGVGIDGATGTYASYKVAEGDIMPINFDADGKTELLVIRNEGAYIVSIMPSGAAYTSSVVYFNSDIKAGHRVFPGDFNGDGNTDLLVRQASSNPYASWNIFTSTGKEFVSTSFSFTHTPALSGDGFSNAHMISIGDYDGDGKTDIVHSADLTTSSSRHYIYYSNGVSFTMESTDWSSSINTECANTTGDFNGDGRADLLSIRAYTVGSSKEYKGHFIFPRPFKEQNLLSGISNLGAQTKFTYSLLNNAYIGGGYGPDVYTRSASQELDVASQPLRSYMVPKPAMYVVSSIERPNGVGAHFKEQYSYEDLVVHRQGRGFLGFAKSTVIDDLSINKVNTQEMNLTYSIMYPKEQLSGLNGTSNLISQSGITTSFQPLAGGRFFMKTDWMHTKNYLTNAGSDVTNTYDTYGNITQSMVRAGSSNGSYLTGVLETTTTTTGYGTYAGAPYPGFPTSITVSKTRDGQPTVSKTTNYTYTSQGWLETVTERVGTPIATTVTNTYNSLGLLTQSSINAPGVSTPVTEQVYDVTGNYLLEKKIIGSGVTKKTTYTYDTRWGVPLTVTSSDGLTTSYIYNTFGERTQTNLPDGNSISETKAWETTGNLRFSILTQRTDGSIPSKTYFDILGRIVKMENRGFGNHWMASEKTYNALGQLESETTPHFSWEPANSTTYTYDSYGRTYTVSNVKGTISTTYSNPNVGSVMITNTNAIGQTDSKTSDASGKIYSSSSNGIAMNFSYDSWGNQLTAASATGTFISNGYDSYGRKTSTYDINIGTVNYQYNAMDQLVQQTDENSIVQNISYDVFGRKVTTSGPQGTTTNTYYYDVISGKNSDNITQIVGFNGDVKTYIYDPLQRLTTETITSGGSNLTKTHTYDSRGRLSTTTYPAGFLIRTIYDDNDIVVQKKYELGPTIKTLFSTDSVNSRGVYNAYSTGNGKLRHVTWDYGKEMPIRYYTAGVQDLNLGFEINTGNLLSRSDSYKGITETFTYDINDKLKSASVNGVQQFGINYYSDGGGRIDQKTGIGNYVYDWYKGYILRSLSPIASEPDPNLTMGPQTYNITYTAFKMPQTITHINGYEVNYSYGSNQQRLASELKYGGATVESRSYWTNIDGIAKGGNTYEVYYIGTGNGLGNIIVKQGSAIDIYYPYLDQLGSIVAVTDESGTMVAEQNFDGWGRKRNPNNWSYSSVPAVPAWLIRGYTGHEQMAETGLVNMNARMYDPLTGQMLAPDNYIKNPWRFDGYNRFTYANGNPLSYIDPDGNNALDFLNPFKKIAAGLKNVFAHGKRGENITFKKAMEYFNQGYIAASIPFSSGPFSEFHDMVDLTAITHGVLKGLFGSGDNRWKIYNNAVDIAVGRYYSDESRSFAGGIVQLASRNMGQSLQGDLGHLYSQARNSAGDVTRVDYFGGATFVTQDGVASFNTAAGIRSQGVTLANYINIKTGETIRGNFETFVRSDALYRHEFGHTIQSEIFGPTFLGLIGSPSLSTSAKLTTEQHDGMWYEEQPEKYSRRYFNRRYR